MLTICGYPRGPVDIIVQLRLVLKYSLSSLSFSEYSAWFILCSQRDSPSTASWFAGEIV
jgi:hypothetical protein